LLVLVLRSSRERTQTEDSSLARLPIHEPLDTIEPMFEPLREDAKLFREVQVDEQLGTIVWPNGADMDPDVLRGQGDAADRADASAAA
jgi:hypothetical protein